VPRQKRRTNRGRRSTEPSRWAIRVGRALSHPERIRLLQLLAEGPTSPSDGAAVTSASIGVLAYHMGELKAAGLIRVASARRVRGAIQHFYELTDDGRAVLMALDAVLRVDPARARPVTRTR
jgi:DNA-binding transcriptional ArsR family regulator